jgi:acyl transferase domain-containing protein/nucleoside-diphosphate-sugar epimerase
MSSNQAPKTLAGLTPVKLALLAQQARADSAALLRADPIAIIGMGCRLPGGAADPQTFWQLLHDGIDAVREVPPARWDVEALYDPDPSAPGKTATKWGGFLDAIDGFDAAFFGILPREAERMDPQQRLFLEVAIEALDHAGLPRERLAGSRTGAFVASYYNEYAQLQYNDPQRIDARTLTGTVHSVLVNRLSYLLDLRGPSISIDTACSSSLVAIHLACQSLRTGECDVALAGGVSLMVSEAQMISLSKVGFMAPDGRCKTFDAKADGFGRGEGCGVLVLKRLADAVADGDRVLAVVRGSAVNQDGRSTVLAAPNGLAQQALIREALANAQVDAADVGYIEAHGTGTALGDPIEVEALAATVGAPADGAPTCWIGAAKANIAHLEAAAGVTGVIKSVLVLQHGAIPPQVHFHALNPHISLAGTRLAVPTRLTPWPAGTKPRTVGTSGFGVGGTNAHVVLQEAPRLSAPPSTRRAAPWLLPLSARSPAALRALAQRWQQWLPHAGHDAAAVCAMAGERRSHHEHRLAVVGSSTQELAAQLQAWSDGREDPGIVDGRVREAGPLRMAFVYGGQGQQWVGMGRELFERERVFADVLEDIDARLRQHVDWSLLEELNAPPERSRLDATEVAQPVIFALQAAFTALWAQWGIQPDAVVGHSVGEIGALYAARVLSLDEALRVVVLRARFMQRATGTGAMAAVGLGEGALRTRLAPFGARLSVGAVNAPRSVVVSGETQALEEMLAQLDAEGVFQRRLPVQYAFHSAQMQPHADALRSALGRVQAQPPQVPVYSTLTGTLLHGAVDADYLARNVREPVRFADAVAALLADGITAFVELAAHPVLGASIAECAADATEPVHVLASQRRGRAQVDTMLAACAGLYAAGRAPDWVGLNGGNANVIDLPAYPWQRERFWLPAPLPTAATAARDTGAADALLGHRLPVAGSTVFEARWPGTAPAWLADHRIGGAVLLPGMVMLEALQRAACTALGTTAVELRDFTIRQALVLHELEGAANTWQVAVPPARADGAVEPALYAPDAAAPGGWRCVASAVAARSTDSPASPMATTAADPDVDRDASIDAIYRAFESHGTRFGPALRTLQRVTLHADGSASAELRVSPDCADAALALLLDGALQACAVAHGGGVPRDALVPMAVERLAVSAPVPAQVTARVTTRREGASVVGDATLHRSDGTLCARLQGARLLPGRAGGAIADAWLHQVQWEPAAAPAQAASAPTGWIVLTDAAGAGAALADTLRAGGQRCVLIGLGTSAVAGAPLRIADPTDAVQWQHVLQQAQHEIGSTNAAVVHLLGTDPHADVATLDTVTLALLQALASEVAGASFELTLVTAGAQPAAGAVPRMAAAHLWGLAGVAMVEHPELSLRLIDLDPDATNRDFASLHQRLLQRGAARCAQRGGQWLEPRLVPVQAPSDGPVQLVPGAQATLDDIAWQAAPSQPLRAGQLRVRVQAAGLNFRDVLIALGMVPGQKVFLGAECAGVVEAVGEGVGGFDVGDTVFGFAPGSLASTVDVDARWVAPWPSELGSLERAASLPVAFLTAMLGLQRIAALRPGQRVLIHAATGGVGLAALQIAQRIGAEVFATAGSPAKRELLQQLGVQHVYDSRTPAFAAAITAATAGHGVDVVLNSLAGDFIGASVDALAHDGCFLELGKRELWSAERFAQVRPRARYAIYDLGASAQQDPQLIRTMLDELLAALRTGTLRALPLRVFEFGDATGALRLMAQARHIGKLALRAPGSAYGTRDVPIRADASYLVTGGLGALGLHTARWLVRRGARHLVLVGRREPTTAARAAIDELSAQGVRIESHELDVADAMAMQALLAGDAARRRPPLRGIVHAAGLLDDGVLLRQSAERFAAVRRGKVLGAQVLDRLTRDLALDFFVLYSAAGQLLGAAGQAPYAAANAELDALAHQRRAVGLPALSVAWGLWQGGGMASASAAHGHVNWPARGLQWIEPDAAFARLETLLRGSAAAVAVLPIDWARFLDTLPVGADASFYQRLRAAPTATVGSVTGAAASSRPLQWKQLPASQRRAAVQAHLLEQTRQVLGVGPSLAIDAGRALKDYGLDSLMAVELRNLLARSLATALPATLLFDHPTLNALTQYMMARLDLEVSRDDTPHAAAADLSNLSEDEAEALLLAELSAPTERSAR